MKQDLFLNFVGGCWVNGRSVAVYRVDAGIKLVAEDQRGTPLGTSQTMSEDMYWALMKRWCKGCTPPYDAAITSAALDYMLGES